MQSLFNVYLELDSVVAICFIILARKPKAKKKIWTDKPHLLSKGEKGVSRENKSKEKTLNKINCGCTIATGDISMRVIQSVSLQTLKLR